jgi:hypothetical protein
MFGNRLGWGISGVLVILAIGAGFMLNKLRQPTPPNPIERRTIGKAAGPMMRPDEAMVRIQLPTSPDTVAKATQAGDSTPKYREAIKLYMDGSAEKEYPRFIDRGKPADADALDRAPINAFVEASGLTQFALFSSSPGEAKKIITFTGDKRELDAIRQLGKATYKLGLFAAIPGGDGKTPRDAALAEKYFTAVFLTGVKMYNERLTYEQYQVGVEQMATANAALKSLYERTGQADKARACAAFDQAQVEYFNTHVGPIQRIVSSIDNKTIAAYFGNVAQLAQGADERMWRIDATLKLGRYRFNAGNIADQKMAGRIVRRMADDESDPFVRLAAELSRDLTSAEYNVLR